ncbi:MAG: NAD(P)H-binding protein [Rhodocyclaceae bacterium]|nr:NAD(P)H-binding protein [Rhodocyclaceae bacterium]MBX3668798.1 NAD(P)H-binding protein [Rhodocyclaceae bacterium]
MERLLIVGCGDVAQRALPWLTRRYRVYALARNSATAAHLRAQGAIPVAGDLDCRKSLHRLAGLAPLVWHFAPPQGTGEHDMRTRALVAALAARGSLPRALVYISTSGVYGDCNGAVVPETRPARPATPRAGRRLDAERSLRQLARRGVRVAILRAPGIYAADRLPLERLLRGDPVLRREDDVRTNHIHADDLARLAGAALHRARGGRVFNAVDDSALYMADYFDQVADACGMARPPRLPKHEAEARLSALTLSFMSESRRLDNRRIKSELRCRLRWPTVATTLASLNLKDTPCCG